VELHGLHVFERLGQGDVDLVVAVGPMKEVEQLELIVEMQGCIPAMKNGRSATE